MKLVREITTFIRWDFMCKTQMVNNSFRNIHPCREQGHIASFQSWVGKISTFLSFPQILISFSHFSSNFFHFRHWKRIFKIFLLQLGMLVFQMKQLILKQHMIQISITQMEANMFLIYNSTFLKINYQIFL